MTSKSNKELKNKPTHTSLPWHETNTGYGKIDIFGKNQHIASLQRREETNENAAFIVRSCNSHYELLEALRIAQACMHSECRSSFYDPAKEKIKQTISKAEGEQ